MDSIRVQYFHYLMVALRKNVIIFEADMSSSVHIDNKKRYLNSWRKTKGLDDITLTAEAKYPISFTQSGKIFVYCIKSRR